MHYTISIPQPDTHFIHVLAVVKNIDSNTVKLQLPSWRPGRYELQNYAKNIRSFSIVNERNEDVSYRKITKDCWEVSPSNAKELHISYEYYANQLDAGASYVDKNLLYINPVNCLLYLDGEQNKPCSVTLAIPDSYEIACQLDINNKTLHAKNFDEMADSPFMASTEFVHHSFKVDKTVIHFWFYGKHSLDIDKLKNDTEKYALMQHKVFSENPCENYHFLYIMLPYRFHHGVEHSNSTVIVMGTDQSLLDEEFYDEFLGISSHELFHLWNIKRIRPEEMLPYDFTKENYSNLGYIYEGVTTYYGDLMLLRSKVWSTEQFTEKMNYQLQRHFSNEGRKHYSVAESSFDTWLDGYVAGVPGRKVSIYVEGMLAAWIADLMIIVHSNGKHSLDDVMKELYVQYYQQQKGYNETIYRGLLEKYSGISFQKYFDDIIWGKNHYESYLNQYLAHIGFTLSSGKLLQSTDNVTHKLFWIGQR